MFEQLLMEAEQSNADYAFLFDLRCPEHAYYRCGMKQVKSCLIVSL